MWFLLNSYQDLGLIIRAPTPQQTRRETNKGATIEEANCPETHNREEDRQEANPEAPIHEGCCSTGERQPVPTAIQLLPNLQYLGRASRRNQPPRRLEGRDASVQEGHQTCRVRFERSHEREGFSNRKAPSVLSRRLLRGTRWRFVETADELKSHEDGEQSEHACVDGRCPIATACS